MKYIFSVILLALPLLLSAQNHRFVVYFTDKDTVAFQNTDPSEYLSARAIERRERQNIAIDLSDFPVNQQYVDSLKTFGVFTAYPSKWYNALLIETDSASLPSINNLAFVRHIDLAAPGSKLQTPLENFNRPPALEEQEPENQQRNASQNEKIGVRLMHEEGYTGKGVLVAVFDGGFSNVDKSSFFDHLRRNNKIQATHDFTTATDDVYRHSQHGTQALSTIAAFREPDYVGIAYDADFILCVTEDVYSEYRIEEYNWLFAAEYADSLGVDVISTSLGYTTFDDPSMNYTPEDMDGKTAVISRASQMAHEKGILSVTSAGNSGNSTWRIVSAPADAVGSLAVGAINITSELASFSSRGPTADDRIKPDVAAVGQGTVLINSRGQISMANGTSFSAPQIAGLAAGVMQARPEWSVSELHNIFRLSGDRSDNPNIDFGFGVPNFARMVGLVTSIQPTKELKKKVRIYPNPNSGQQLFLHPLVDMTGAEIIVQVLNAKGQKIIQSSLSWNENNGNYTLEISQLSSGVYIVKFFDGQTTETHQLIVL
ncbi:MAG: S8 family serine peptidase [Cyclobacteriaceae bacterium]|nr:S8 family serine peptidase [Cyclobacteriaceae bacterium]MCH8516056.1 S8 family serine peptidase [Cyclobacteriaceae bacterium]